MTLFNKTRIAIVDGRLEVGSGPIPVFGNKSGLTVKGLQQVFCEKHKHKTKRSKYYTYSLNVMTKDGEKVRVIKKLGEKAALFAEKTLEDLIGIVDQKIEGEYRGK